MAGLAMLANETWAEAMPACRIHTDTVRAFAQFCEFFPQAERMVSQTGPCQEQSCTQPTMERNCRWEVACGAIVMWRALYPAAQCCSPYFTICLSNSISHCSPAPTPSPAKLDDLLFLTHKFFKLYAVICFLFPAYLPHLWKFDLNLRNPSQMPLLWKPFLTPRWLGHPFLSTLSNGQLLFYCF